MTNNSTAVTPNNVPVITHAGQPVVTTALLASLYGTDAHNIIKNYTNNDGRFVVGKHFHKLEGAELKDFKDKVTQSDVVNKRAKHLILWTERGAARHAKMLDTDEAWEVFEKLEDSYFVKVGPGSEPSLAIPVEPHFSPERQRWLLSFDHQGNQKVTPIPANAFVLSHHEYLNGLFVHGDIPLSTEEMFDIAMAALARLKSRHDVARAQRAAV